MAARRPSWIFFRAHYLKKDSSNQFEIFIVYWDISEDLRYRISDRSEIQYGRQVAILDFLSRALSHQFPLYFSLLYLLLSSCLDFFYKFFYIGTYFMMRAYQIVAALPCPPCNWRGLTVDSYESHRV